MIKNKVRILIVLFLLSITTIYGQSCNLGTQNQDCERISSSLNTYKIEDISSQELFDRYEVEIFESNNPSNKLKSELDGTQIIQKTPYLNPGTYNVSVRAYDKSQNYLKKDFVYVFDNIEPIPPIVPLNLNSNEPRIEFQGTAIAGAKVIAQSSKGTEISRAPVGDDGSFTMEIDNLDTGINYIKFSTVGPNALESDIVERVIHIGDITPLADTKVSSITLSSDLDEINARSVSGVGDSIKTSKRNFYVKGRANGPDGSIVYINGVRAMLHSGKFAAFVLLNEGENQIIAKTPSASSAPVTVEYLNPRFQILRAQIDKIVSKDSVSISGKANFDLPIQIYLNGEYVSEVEPESGNFKTSVGNLKEGKNFVEIRGLNNERITQIVYYDTKTPQITALGDFNFAKPGELVFKVEDDIGINLNSIEMKIDGKSLQSEDLEVKNDYLIFDISHLNEASSYLLSGEDLATKGFSKSGTININEGQTLIEDIYLENAELIGDRLFLKEGKNRLNILPSKNIAFKSIYLDGVEQIDYEIFENNIAVLDIEPENKSGTLTLNFINSNYDEFTKEYEYFISFNEPVVELDFIDKTKSEDYSKISGEIKGEYVNWNSISLNGQKNIFKYGDYFEAIVDLDKSGSDNLVISGNDYAYNVFSKTFGSLLFKDTTSSDVVVDEDKNTFNHSLTGQLHNSDESIGNYNFINSYDGFRMRKAYIGSDKFNLPLQQREGYRSINFRGFESSQRDVYSTNTYSVNYSNADAHFDSAIQTPQIFFNGNDKVTSNSKGFIQGNVIASSPITNVETKGDCKFDSTTFVCIVDLRDGQNEFDLQVTAGSSASASYTITKISNDIDISLEHISGDDVRESGERFLLTGPSSLDLEGIVDKEAAIKVLIGSREISAGKVEELSPQRFTIPVDIAGELDGIENKEFEAQLVAQDEFGNKAFSEKLTLIYKRVVETFTKVVVR